MVVLSACHIWQKGFYEQHVQLRYAPNIILIFRVNIMQRNFTQVIQCWYVSYAVYSCAMGVEANTEGHPMP